MTPARKTVLALHRWAGLAMLAFLFLTGVTGSVLAFHEEIDGWLNRDWFFVEERARQASVDAIVARAEAAIPTHRPRYIDLPNAPGRSLDMIMNPRPEAPEAIQGQQFQMFADPHTGELLGWRDRNAIRFDGRHIVRFLYKFHYSLHLGDTGVWLLGGVAALWLLDNLWAAWLCFPKPRLWRRSFAVRLGAGSRRATYDSHRAGGLWFWPVLVVLAISGVAMNLYEPVRSLVGWFSPLTPAYEEQAPPRAHASPIGHDAAIRAAETVGPVDGIVAAPDKGLYNAFVHGPGDRAYYGETTVAIDGATGAILDVARPGEDSAGDVFLAWQFPLHSGRAFGLPGQVLIALAGLVVAALSLTGFWLWAKRRRPKAGTQDQPRASRQLAPAE